MPIPNPKGENKMGSVSADFSNQISSPEWVQHLQQIEESDGFDIDVFPTKCHYRNVDVQLHNGLLVDLVTNYALPNYNSDKHKHYVLTSVEKAVVCSICYFITFKATDGDSRRTFQTKCCVSRNHKRALFTRIRNLPAGDEGVPDWFVYKSRLLEHTREVGWSAPVYETIVQTSSSGPTYRSTVVVNDVRYDCLDGFTDQNEAEHSAAEVALVQLSRSGEMKEFIAQPENYKYAVRPIKLTKLGTNGLRAKEVRLRLKKQLYRQRIEDRRAAAAVAAPDKHVNEENAKGSVAQACSHEFTSEFCDVVPVEEVPAATALMLEPETTECM